MALMFPEEIIKEKYPSELFTFDMIKDQLSNEWIGLHSIEMSEHIKHSWGQTDFVLIGPPGIFVIEVKGGGVIKFDSQKKGWIYY